MPIKNPQKYINKSNILRLKRELKTLEREQKNRIEENVLKANISRIKKQIPVDINKKSSFLSTIGASTVKIGEAGISIAKKIATPPSPAQQKVMEANKKKLKELIGSGF